MGLQFSKADTVVQNAGQLWTRIERCMYAQWKACRLVSNSTVNEENGCWQIPEAHPTIMCVFGTPLSSPLLRYIPKERPNHLLLRPYLLPFSQVITVAPFLTLVSFELEDICKFAKQGLLYSQCALAIDPTCRYMITTSGNRGWDGTSTNACLFYDIHPIAWSAEQFAISIENCKHHFLYCA